MQLEVIFMSEEEQLKVFANNLRYYMNESGKRQTDIVNDLGIKKQTISGWMNARRIPRMAVIQELSEYFGIKVSQLVNRHDHSYFSVENDKIINDFLSLSNEDKLVVKNVIDRLKKSS